MKILSIFIQYGILVRFLTLYFHLRHVNADGKNAAAIIRQGGVPLSQFLKYCESRRQSRRVDEMVIINDLQNTYMQNLK